LSPVAEDVTFYVTRRARWAWWRGLVAPRAYRPHSMPAARDTSTNLVVVGRAAN